jgi:hypothetical protein
MYALVTATAAFLAEIVPVVVAVGLLYVAFLYLWDLWNKGWENSALYKNLLQIKQILDNLEKNPLIHGLLYLSPAAPLVAANDLYNSGIPQKLFNTNLGWSGSAGSPQITVHVQAIANAQPLSKDEHAALVTAAVKTGIAQGLGDKQTNAVIDKRITSDFMAMGF